MPLAMLLIVGTWAVAALGGGSDDRPEQTEATAGATADADVSDDPGGDAPPGGNNGQDNNEDAGDAATEQQQARETLAGLATREPDDPRALGDPEAPIVMVQWADFLCPFCGVFARDIEPELITRYAETGVLRIEWRDLPLQGDQALLAALGGQAAAQQSAFWTYHEALFAEDLRQAENRVDRDFLLSIADDLALDTGTFDADLDDPALEQLTQQEAATGRSLGISGTPAFIIGGYPLIGARPLETFIQVIEAAALDAGVELP